jgi:hypothetical protein
MRAFLENASLQLPQHTRDMRQVFLPDLPPQCRQQSGCAGALLADESSANPQVSICGWERAVDAQARMVKSVERIATMEQARMNPGAVGTLLYCHPTGQANSGRCDQPANGGGNWFRFPLTSRRVFRGSQPLDGL